MDINYAHFEMFLLLAIFRGCSHVVVIICVSFLHLQFNFIIPHFSAMHFSHMAMANKDRCSVIRMVI